MLTFKPVTVRDGNILRRYYQNCGYALSAYSFGKKLRERATLRSCWAEVCGCLVVRGERGGHWVFDYPVPGTDGDEGAALRAIEDECLSKNEPPRIRAVPEEKAAVLLARYPYVRVSDVRTEQDYLYDATDLRLFRGRRYAGQRNHQKQFRLRCPDAVFRPLTRADAPAVAQFWETFEADFPKRNDSAAMDELSYAKRILKQADKPWFVAGGLFDGETLIALSLAEQCGDTLMVHVEKALYSYPGAYPVLVQEFANAFGTSCRRVNRGEDAAQRGLRMSKLQYVPVRLLSGYDIEPENELSRYVTAIPELRTSRLTLNAIGEADIPLYNELVLDERRNRWWGYDDVAGLTEPIHTSSFYDVARQDFENRLAINFAIRLDGQFIGEAVLYRFDYRGGAELGCRISRAYSGHGYGTEAFAAVAEWGLYALRLRRIFAKCFKENRASYRMLSSCMRRTGKDDTFFYFEKLF